MPASRIAYKQWVHLYDLADALYALSPWEWMEEDELIALKHPETGETGYVSLMGAVGEYECLAVYLGEEALHRFNLLHDVRENDEMGLTDYDRTNLLLETRQLHASFEVRDALEKVELEQIKRLKRRYRGENWPQFQSYRPGHSPGPINARDIEWLTLAIEQTLACVEQFQGGKYEDTYLVEQPYTMPCREQVDGEWRQSVIPYDDTLYQFPSPEPSELLAAKVARHGRVRVVQCRCCIMTNAVGKKYGDRQFPYLLIAVDAESGFVYGVKLLSVKEMSHEKLIDSVPDEFLKMFDKNGLCPEEIQVGDHTTGMLLHHVSIAIERPIEFHHRLSALDAAMADMPI